MDWIKGQGQLRRSFKHNLIKKITLYVYFDKQYNELNWTSFWSWIWNRAWTRYPSSQLLWNFIKSGLYTIYCQFSSAYLHRNPRSSPLAWWKNARWHLYSINLVGDKLNLDIKPFEPICKVGMIWIPNVSLVPVK